MTTVIRCLSVAAVVVMTGCADSHSDNKEKEENHGHEEHGNEIVIKHEQIEKLGIKTTGKTQATPSSARLDAEKSCRCGNACGIQRA